MGCATPELRKSESRDRHDEAGCSENMELYRSNHRLASCCQRQDGEQHEPTAPQSASIDSLPEWHDANRHLSYVGADKGMPYTPDEFVGKPFGNAVAGIAPASEQKDRPRKAGLLS
jgi:hypothetical protein